MNIMFIKKKALFDKIRQYFFDSENQDLNIFLSNEKKTFKSILKERPILNQLVSFFNYLKRLLKWTLSYKFQF